MHEPQKTLEVSFDTIFLLQDIELQQYLCKVLEFNKRKMVLHHDFLYSPGTVPVLLVAHMDTVHTKPPTICKSADGEIVMAPEGIGGDDRCGVYILMKIIEEYDCHVLFTHDEECGGIGAKSFIKSGIMPEVNFIVEPDRKGSNDAVYYNCFNVDFKEFVEDTTGYIERYGIFSDISIIAPHMNRAAVNLSCGYYNPHTSYEYVKMSEVKETAQAIKLMIEKMNPEKVSRIASPSATQEVPKGMAHKERTR